MIILLTLFIISFPQIPLISNFIFALKDNLLILLWLATAWLASELKIIFVIMGALFADSEGKGAVVNFVMRAFFIYSLRGLQNTQIDIDCFHTRAKCAIWIAHFELRIVHTREVIAIFELRSVHTRDWIWDFAILHSSGGRMSGYPANQTCTELAFPVLLYICSVWYIGGSG